MAAAPSPLSVVLASSPVLDDTVKTLAWGKNLAAVTSLRPDEQPTTRVVWVDADDDPVCPSG